MHVIAVDRAGESHLARLVRRTPNGRVVVQFWRPESVAWSPEIMVQPDALVRAATPAESAAAATASDFASIPTLAALSADPER